MAADHVPFALVPADYRDKCGTLREFPVKARLWEDAASFFELVVDSAGEDCSPHAGRTRTLSHCASPIDENEFERAHQKSSELSLATCDDSERVSYPVSRPCNTILMVP